MRAHLLLGTSAVLKFVRAGHDVVRNPPMSSWLDRLSQAIAGHMSMSLVLLFELAILEQIYDQTGTRVSSAEQWGRFLSLLFQSDVLIL